MARLELGHDALGKDLEQLADMLVPVGATLLDQHDLVDPGALVAGEMLGRLLVWKLERTPMGRRRPFLPATQAG